ncbi:hypothetical protein HU200_007064 [Digitaria exilis]|uniref:Uncharacterized protein n=1 Tax=Digitaria exilis TaxID=1010633 RepID=A0A835FNF5_9POAL|nr:hypothetical protein HU200_007064 [Digitaria exilis]
MRQHLGVPFFMEIIILMSWCIWTTRNDWIFRNLDPMVQNCKRRFIQEYGLLRHRAKPQTLAAMAEWLDSIN